MKTVIGLKLQKREKKDKRKHSKRSKDQFNIQRSLEAKKWRRVNAAINELAKNNEKLYTFSNTCKGKSLPSPNVQMFSSLEELFKVIESYAKAVGFKLKFTKTWSKNRNIIWSRGGGIQLSTVKGAKTQDDPAEMTGCPFEIKLKEFSNGEWAVREIINRHNHAMTDNAEPEFNEDTKNVMSKLRADIGADISYSVKNYSYHLYFKEGHDLKTVIDMLNQKYTIEKFTDEQIKQHIENWKTILGEKEEYVVNFSKFLLSKQKECQDLDFKARKDHKLIWWTTIPKKRRQMISDVIAIDTRMTPSYNKSNWYMMIFMAIDHYGIVQPIFTALMHNVMIKKIVMALKFYIELGFGKPFRVICDAEHNLIEGFKEKFNIGRFKYDLRIIICPKHYDQSLKVRLYQTELQTNTERNQFIDTLYKALTIDDKNECKSKFKTMWEKHKKKPLLKALIKDLWKSRSFANIPLIQKFSRGWKVKQDRINKNKIKRYEKKEAKKFNLANDPEIPMKFIHYKTRQRLYG